MNLVQLRCLVALADSDLRLTVAADYAEVSERVLLEHVKQIEEELGLPIVLRRGRKVEAITRAGTGIIRRARAVLDGVTGIQGYGLQEGAGRPGRLILSATHTQAKYVLPQALAQFRREYPNLTVLVREPLHRHQEQRVEKTVDLVIHSTSGSPPADGTPIPLYRWRRRLIVPRDHPLADPAQPLTLRRIADFPLISFHLSTRRESSLQRAFAKEGLKPQISITTLNADLVKTYVRAGSGVGILPEMALCAQDHDLFACRLLPDIPDCITWAVIPRNSPVRDSTLQLIGLLAPHLAMGTLRAVLEGKGLEDWTEIPHWQTTGVPASSVTADEIR